MRIRVFKDELPRAEAITMNRWRTSTLIEVSFERYFYAWLSLLLPLGLMLLRPRHLWVSIVLSLLPPIAVFVGGMLLALLGSIGHNHANTRGFLAVLQGGFPVFMIVVAGVWCVGLFELWRWFRRRGQGAEGESIAGGRGGPSCRNNSVAPTQARQCLSGLRRLLIAGGFAGFTGGGQ